MSRRPLIAEAAVLEAARAGHTQLAVPSNALITPLARDTAREKGIAFVEQTPDDKPDCGCSAPKTNIIAIGSDHGGYALKEALKPYLNELGWKYHDVGTHSEQSCDYPDFAYGVARLVKAHQADLGVMIDGAGIGSAMVCNKVPGIRAACAYNEFTAWNARAHNNANVLTLGSRTLGSEVCKRILKTFLETAFEGGRHERRVEKIDDVEARFAAP